jgi:hypothetical protein
VLCVPGGQATHILTKTNNIIQEKKLKEKKKRKKMLIPIREITLFVSDFDI